MRGKLGETSFEVQQKQARLLLTAFLGLMTLILHGDPQATIFRE